MSYFRNRFFISCSARKGKAANAGDRQSHTWLNFSRTGESGTRTNWGATPSIKVLRAKWATEEWPFGRKGVSTKNNNLTLQSQISNHTDKQVGRPESICFLKMGQSRPLFVYFRDFLNTISIIQIEKSVDGVLGIRTRGCRMVGADQTTELWRPPIESICCWVKFI